MAQAYPESCIDFILRGIFLACKREIDNLFYGLQDIFPDKYEEFLSNFTQEEKGDIISTLYTKIMNQDPKISVPASKAIMNFA